MSGPMSMIRNSIAETSDKAEGTELIHDEMVTVELASGLVKEILLLDVIPQSFSYPRNKTCVQYPGLWYINASWEAEYGTGAGSTLNGT